MARSTLSYALPIVLFTLRFAPSYNPQALQRALPRGYNRMLLLTFSSVAVENDPIIGSTHFVSEGSIGKKSCVLVFSASGVKHGEPCALVGIEPPWSDPPQLAGASLGTILAIDIQ